MTLNEVMKFHHPYIRYGWAIALYQSEKNPDVIDVTEIPSILIYAIELGLGNFRYKTDNNPATDDVLKYEKIGLTALRQDSTLVMSKGLSDKGCYLAPSVISTDGDAEKTFKNAEAIIKDLKEMKKEEVENKLLSRLDTSRSFAPTTSKINNGKSSQAPPKITLFEAACSVITTVTSLKPAFLYQERLKKGGEDEVNFYYTGIIPDLPIIGLLSFIKLFHLMQTRGIKEDLMERKIFRKPNDLITTKDKVVKQNTQPNLFTEGENNVSIPIEKKNEKSKKRKKNEFSRPRIHDGNYPFAPYDNNAFGALGVFAAMGKWAEKAEDHAKKTYQSVLQALVGNEQTSGVPIYVVSYDKISHVQFSHHIAKLAIDSKLNSIIASLSRETILYSQEDLYPENKLYLVQDPIKRGYDYQKYKLFNMMASRFLQQFNEASFYDFLAFRAEYSITIQPLFDRYFMNKQDKKISRDVVESARAFGQWINYAADQAADKLYDNKVTDHKNKVAKEKAKILAEFESTAMGVEDGKSLDLLARFSIRAGRYLQSDAPPNAALFMDAVACGSVEFEDARNLILAYSRLAKTWGSRRGGTDDDPNEATENTTITTNELTN